MEFSVKSAKVTDYGAEPRVYVWTPGEIPDRIITSIDVAQVGVTVKTKFVEPVCTTPLAFVIVP